MKVLITPQFNSAMLSLDKTSQSEVAYLYNFCSTMTREQILDSSLSTKLTSGDGDIFTLRSSTVRVFCSFDQNGDLLFLDVAEVKIPSIESPAPLKGEITLFDSMGDPQVYIATSEDNTAYSFKGQPLAYIDKNNNIYGFNGQHLGWFEDGIVWDHRGSRVGFIKSACPTFTKFEPFKGFKHFKPFKNFQTFAPFKPFKSYSVSQEGLLRFFEKGINK